MKNEETVEQVRAVQRRLSQLADRIVILESDLRRTREQISVDIQKIVTTMGSQRKQR